MSATKDQEHPMNIPHTVSAEALAEQGGDIFAALLKHEEVKKLTDFQMALYIMAREAGDDHPNAMDFAVDGPFKEATK